jgi:hypothetical protein
MGRQELGAIFERVCVDADAPQGTLVIRVPFLIFRCPNETTLKVGCVSFKHACAQVYYPVKTARKP